MQKNEEKRKTEKEARDNSDFSLYDKSGRQKSLGWSVASMAVGILSLLLSPFGWTGILLGVTAIVFAIVARVKIGYFNVFIIVGIVSGIFGTVLGIFFCVFSIFLPDILKWLEGFLTTDPNTENV